MLLDEGEKREGRRRRLPFHADQERVASPLTLHSPSSQQTPSSTATSRHGSGPSGCLPSSSWSGLAWSAPLSASSCKRRRQRSGQRRHDERHERGMCADNELKQGWPTPQPRRIGMASSDDGRLPLFFFGNVHIHNGFSTRSDCRAGELAICSALSHTRRSTLYCSPSGYSARRFALEGNMMKVWVPTSIPRPAHGACHPPRHWNYNAAAVHSRHRSSWTYAASCLFRASAMW